MLFESGLRGDLERWRDTIKGSLERGCRIEDELVREFLIEKKPGYQWQVYQVDIVRRVQQRAKKRRVVVELSALTDVVAGRLREFSVFEKGERSKRGFVHEYTSRERYW